MSNLTQDEKIIRLVMKVEVLSMIADELQNEIYNIKLNPKNVNNKTSTASKQSEILYDNRSKLSLFQRLNLRKNNKKTKVKDIHKSDVSDLSDQVTVRNRSRNRQFSLARNDRDFEVFNIADEDEEQQNEINCSTQTKNFTIDTNDLPGFICTVTTCSAQTEEYQNKSKKSKSKRKFISLFRFRKKKKNKINKISDKAEKKSKTKEAPFEGCANTKKSKHDSGNTKLSKSKKGKCAKNCPYLNSNASTNRSENPDKKIKSVKNKKLMVNLD